MNDEPQKTPALVAMNGPIPRPDLELANHAVPRLHAVCGLMRLLSTTEGRELLCDDELDELLAWASEGLGGVIALLTRWQAQAEIG